MLKDFYIQGEESCVAPVFYEPTTINNDKATATFNVQQNHSVAHPIAVMVSGSNLTAQLIDDTSAYITANADAVINIAIATAALNDYSMKKGETIRVYLDENNEVRAESVSPFPVEPDAIRAPQTTAGTEATYTLQGTRVTSTEKAGIYIVNGQKMLQK